MKKLRRGAEEDFDIPEEEQIEASLAQASRLGGLLADHVRSDGKTQKKAAKAVGNEKDASLQVVRAWDHALQLAGMGLATFASGPMRSSILKPGEIRYFATTAPWAEITRRTVPRAMPMLTSLGRLWW